MDKMSCRVLTLTVGCIVLLSVTAEQAFSWPCLGGCPACKTCTPIGCVCSSACCNDSHCGQDNCNKCVNCSCEYRCDIVNCEVCQDDSCVDACPLFESCLECDGNGSCIVCGGDPDQACCNDECYNINTQKCCTDAETDYICDINDTCCEGTCCPDNKCCVDGECITGYCRPWFDLEDSGECDCYAFECGGSITQTWVWYCQEHDGGCPWGTECVQTGTLDCYTSRRADCIDDCLTSGSECAFSDWEYAPKAPRVLCGCCD